MTTFPQGDREKIACERCSAVVELPVMVARRQVTCPGCGAVLQTPRPSFDEQMTFRVEEPSSAGTIWALVACAVLAIIAAVMFVGIQWMIKAQKRSNSGSLINNVPIVTIRTTGESNGRTIMAKSSAKLPESYPQLRLQPDHKHVYAIKISSGEADDIQKLSGHCDYTVGKTEVDPRARRFRTGSAIVVSSDGYLVTCLHLVDFAEKTNVFLGTKSYRAALVAQNPEADLALLKIKADDLPVCSISNFQQEPKAPCSVVGHAIGSAPRDKVNVADASIARTAIHAGAGRRLFIDSDVLIESNGQVILGKNGAMLGITCTRNFDSQKSTVAYGIPSSQIYEFLAACDLGIDHHEQPPAPTLEDPRPQVPKYLARVAAIGTQMPAVRQVSFKTMVPGLANSLYSVAPAHSSIRRPGPQLLINRYGEVVADSKKPVWLPYALGALEQLVFVPLDVYGRKEWAVDRMMWVDTPNYISRTMATKFYPPQSLIARHKYPQAHQRIVGRIVEESPDSFTKIEYTKHLTTTGDSDTPELEIRGTYNVEFDVRRGIAILGQYEGNVTQNRNGRSISFPVSFEFRRKDEAELAAEAEKEKQRKDKISEQNKIRLSVPNPELASVLLEQLQKARTSSQASSLLTQLRRMAVVEEVRDRVITECEKHRSGNSDSTSEAAVGLFVWYATEDHTEELEQIATSRSRRVRRSRYSAASKLLKLDQLDFLPQMVELAAEPFIHREAVRILGKAGAVAEPLILKGLKQGYSDIEQSRLVDALEKIGTELSLDELHKIKSEGSAFSRSSARSAIRAIENRMKEQNKKPAELNTPGQ